MKVTSVVKSEKTSKSLREIILHFSKLSFDKTHKLLTVKNCSQNYYNHYKFKWIFKTHISKQPLSSQYICSFTSTTDLSL